jgi:hypothetical protein
MTYDFIDPDLPNDEEGDTDDEAAKDLYQLTRPIEEEPIRPDDPEFDEIIEEMEEVWLPEEEPSDKGGEESDDSRTGDSCGFFGRVYNSVKGLF